ncbi:MAG: hypothetical protein D6675_14395 [Gemmatimonadetes bacterium]|nr:MAG: hypothetical protein D6675_14395 [Gemmatimonadota bacterium]
MAELPLDVKLPDAEVKKVQKTFDQILLNHLKAGYSKCTFEADKPLMITKNGQDVQNPNIQVTAPLMAGFLRQVTAFQNGINFNETNRDLVDTIVGSKGDYAIEHGETEDRKAILFFVRVIKLDRDHYRLTIEHEPDVKVGYPQLVDISQIKDEDKLHLWFDDFVVRVMSIKNPKPKDIIFAANKSNPYIAITGGLRPLTDVLVRPGVTNRLAMMLIKLSGNPAMLQKIKDNFGKLDTQDIDVAYKTKTNRRLRVNIADTFDMDQEHGCLITMRILPERPVTLDVLNMPSEESRFCLRDWVKKIRMGLFLINGTTGSGKSTTMCALIDYLLRTRSINLITIENPIETMFNPKMYPRSIISQRELGKHSITLHKALESCVRQTLNVAMVGEIRNSTDCMMALELAQAGHLIFATLHAGTVGESIGRMIEMFPADQEKKIREMLASQYRVGLAQILVRGLEGQVEMVLERMWLNDKIRELIEKKQKPGEEKSMRELLEMHKESAGMESLDQCMVGLLQAGRISEDVLMFNSPNPDAVLYRKEKLGLKLSAKWDMTGHTIEKAMDEFGIKGKEDEVVSLQLDRSRRR